MGAGTRQRREGGSSSASNVGRTGEAERCGEHWLVGAGGRHCKQGKLSEPMRSKWDLSQESHISL